MNFHAMKHFSKSRIIMVYNLAVSQIQFCDLRHIFLAELEIPDIRVLLHAVFMHGFRNHHNKYDGSKP